MPPAVSSLSSPPDRLAPQVSISRCQIVESKNRCRSRPYTALAGLVIAGWVMLNLAYLVDCPLDLAPDEAHYWDWSRHPDWSYYSKGPLVAWLIRASCEIFGGLSVALIGSEMAAVRLPAVLSSAALLAGFFVLTNRTLRSPCWGLAAVALAGSLPPLHAASLVMTIDPPFLACWCWAIVFLHRAVDRGGLAWWLAAGACSALGVLAKYPMLLLLPAVAGFLWLHRREALRRRGFAAFVLLSLLGLLPIFLWNAGHGWVSLRHVLGQTGVSSAEARGIRWLGPLEFAGGQFAMLLGFWFVAFAAAGWQFRRSRDTGLSLLWWSSVPVWGVFLGASLFSPGEVNWPAAAYIGGFVLALAWIRERLARTAMLKGMMALAIAAGIGTAIWLRFPGISRPVLAAIAGSPSEANPTPIRRFDPTCRLRGWRTLAAEVDAIRDRIATETGREPILAGMAWTTPGELAVYCRGHPEVYSFGTALADRHSQYDLWRPNPVADPDQFRGRSFIYVGNGIPHGDRVFDRIEDPMTVVHREDGVPVAVWKIWVGHGFRGFPKSHFRSGSARY